MRTETQWQYITSRHIGRREKRHDTKRNVVSRRNFVQRRRAWRQSVETGRGCNAMVCRRLATMPRTSRDTCRRFHALNAWPLSLVKQSCLRPGDYILFSAVYSFFVLRLVDNGRFLTIFRNETPTTPTRILLRTITSIHIRIGKSVALERCGNGSSWGTGVPRNLHKGSHPCETR